MSAIKSNLFGRNRIQNDVPGVPLALPSMPDLSLSTMRGVSAASWAKRRLFLRHTCSSSLTRWPFLRARHVALLLPHSQAGGGSAGPRGSCFTRQSSQQLGVAAGGGSFLRPFPERPRSARKSAS